MINRGPRFANESMRDDSTQVIRPASQANGRPSFTQQLTDLVGEDLTAIERLIKSSTASRFPEVNQLCGHAASMGGKRLRPILAILAARACDESPTDRSEAARNSELHGDLRFLGASVELVHAASLVHDDVMDNAVTRRHKPTIGRLAGSSSAILLGDFLFTKAYALAAQCRSRHPARKIAKAASELCEGELRQQLSAGDWQMNIREYRSLLTQKTASLCSVSCWLGAWVGGGEERHRAANAKAMSRFGMQLGLAFQLFDDWLDYWGTDEVGKTLGSDLNQRKPTLPLLRLLQTASPEERKQLVGVLDSSQTNGHKDIFDDVRKRLDRSDASEFTLRIARRCVAKAIGWLERLPQSESKECLKQIAIVSVARVA